MALRIIQFLGDRHAGFILCLIVIVNMIVGSLVMNGYPDLYPPFFPLDLNQFFQPVRVEHSWLYLLLLTFSLFGINLLAGTIETTLRLINNRVGRLRATAALLFHIALLITLLAHLYEGFFSHSGQTMISQQPVELPGMGTVKMESLKYIYHPDGSLKDAEVRLLFTQADGQQLTKDIAFNEPAIFDKGRRQVVMLTAQKMPAGVVLHNDLEQRSYHFMPEVAQTIGTGRLVLQGIFQSQTGIPYAQFLWRSAGGQQKQLFMALDAGMPQQSQLNLDGKLYRYQELIEMHFIVAIIRHNPAVPLMLVSLLLASVALMLLIRWVMTRNKNRSVRGDEAPAV